MQVYNSRFINSAKLLHSFKFFLDEGTKQIIRKNKHFFIQSQINFFFISMVKNKFFKLK